MTTVLTATPTRLDSALERPLKPVRRRFRRDEHAPEAARNFAADVLARRGITADVTDIAKLLVSEAVTNAYRYASRGQIRVAVAVGDKQISIVVTDAGRARAALPTTAPDDDAENGRGWMLIEALSADCGIERIGGGNGHRVFFTLATDGVPE